MRQVRRAVLTKKPSRAPAGFEDDGQIRVLFVEYGNEQLCAFEDLRYAVAQTCGERLF